MAGPDHILIAIIVIEEVLAFQFRLEINRLARNEALLVAVWHE
jgi:hypothetical protein